MSVEKLTEYHDSNFANPIKSTCWPLDDCGD